MLLTSTNDAETVLVVALRSAEGWRLEKLRSWTGDRSRLYVTTALAGQYHRAAYLDGPLELGEVAHVTAKHAGIITGRTEASGIYYFSTPNGWVHVWVVD
jgi:hypothetical protein